MTQTPDPQQITHALSCLDEPGGRDALRELLTDPTPRAPERPWLPNRFTESSWPGVGAVHAEVARAIVARVSAADPLERAEWGALLLYAPAAEARPAAMALARDPDLLARLVGLQLLGELGDHDAGDLVRDALAAPETAIRVAAVAALGRIGTGDDEARLVSSLDDAAPQVRHWAARALGELAGERATGTLLARARDESLDDVTWLGIRLALEHLGATARDGLLELLQKSSVARVQRRAAEALSVFPDTTVKWELATRLKKGELEVQLMAAWSLARMDDGRGKSRLLDELRSSDERRAILGATLMASLGSGAAIVKLLGRYFDPNVGEFVRNALQTVPVSGHGDIAELVKQALNDKLARAACDLAGRLGVQAARPWLERLLPAPQLDVAAAAAVALGRMQIRTRALRELLERTPDPIRRLAIAVSLRELYPPLPLLAVEALLHDAGAPIAILGIEALLRGRVPGASLLAERLARQELERLAGRLPARPDEQNTPLLGNAPFMQGLLAFGEMMRKTIPAELGAKLDARTARAPQDPAMLVLSFALPAWVDLDPAAASAAEAALSAA